MVHDPVVEAFSAAISVIPLRAEPCALGAAYDWPKGDPLPHACFLFLKQGGQPVASQGARFLSFCALRGSSTHQGCPTRAYLFHFETKEPEDEPRRPSRFALYRGVSRGGG